MSALENFSLEDRYVVANQDEWFLNPKPHRQTHSNNGVGCHIKTAAEPPRLVMFPTSLVWSHWSQP